MFERRKMSQKEKSRGTIPPGENRRGANVAIKKGKEGGQTMKVEARGVPFNQKIHQKKCGEATANEGTEQVCT